VNSVPEEYTRPEECTVEDPHSENPQGRDGRREETLSEIFAKHAFLSYFFVRLKF